MTHDDWDSVSSDTPTDNKTDDWDAVSESQQPPASARRRLPPDNLVIEDSLQSDSLPNQTTPITRSFQPSQLQEDVVVIPPSPPPQGAFIAPSISKPFNAWRMGRVQMIAMMVGIIVCALLLSLFTYRAYAESPPFIISYFNVLLESVFLFITVILFFGAAFGPWVGLAVGGGGGILGQIIAGYLLFSQIGYLTLHLSDFVIALTLATVGFLAGLATLSTKGRYRSMHTTALASFIIIAGIIILYSILLLVLGEGGDMRYGLPYIEINVPFNLILLPISLLIYDRVAHRKSAQKHNVLFVTPDGKTR